MNGTLMKYIIDKQIELMVGVRDMEARLQKKYKSARYVSVGWSTNFEVGCGFVRASYDVVNFGKVIVREGYDDPEAVLEDVLNIMGVER